MNVIVKALACAAFIAATPAAATNILDNSGFETGSLTPWYQANDFSGGTDWFVTDADSHTGTFSAEDTGNKELRQDFAGVLGSTIDQVSFWARHPNEGTNTALAYTFYYSDNTNAEFLVALVGLDWNFFDVTAQLDTTKTLTGFSIYGNSVGNPPVTRADDFVIDVAGGVPEPGTWAMMMLGFGLTGLAIRRRRVRASAALA
jgi:hypothetical protein